MFPPVFLSDKRDHQNGLLDYYGFIQRICEKSYIPDANPHYDIYRLHNDYLTFLIKESDVSDLADRMIALEDFLKNKHIELLYVQTPYKICKYDSKLPKGCPEDFSNTNTDRFLELIQQGGISTIDLREKLHDIKMDHYSMFFRTDHHWPPEAGFWAFQVLAKELTSHYGFQINPDYLDMDYYNKEIYPDWFLGSLGKRVGSRFVAPDDFMTIKPRFDTEIASTLLKGTTTTGKFEDTILVDFFVKNNNYHIDNAYLFYTGNEIEFHRIVNKKANNHKKVLLVHDSFARVAIPYLALCCEELVTDDIRRNAIPLIDTINELNPDIVIFMYCPSSLMSDASDSFTNGSFDFGFLSEKKETLSER